MISNDCVNTVVGAVNKYMIYVNYFKKIKFKCFTLNLKVLHPGNTSLSSCGIEDFLFITLFW